MDTNLDSKPSFTVYRRWGTGLQVVLVLCLVFSVVVMVNYLSRDYYLRWYVSANTKIPLAPRTVKLLEGLTNDVKITLYYDKDEPFYATVRDLLDEYRRRSSKIALHIVDYKRDPVAAQQLKTKYKFLETAKNMVIFDCEGRGVRPIDGNALTKYVMEQILSDEKERQFRRKPTTFEGERAFTAALLQVTSPRPFKACFLTGHGEHSIENTDPSGYYNFAALLAENYIQPASISLLGTNTIPADCLLVIAGPGTALNALELDKIEQFLNQAGRLMVLFNFRSVKTGDTGLETLLAKWGVDVGRNVIVDKDNTVTGNEVYVRTFNSAHPVVNPLLGEEVSMALPRSISKIGPHPQAVDLPQVDEVAFSGPNSVLASPSKPEKRAYPVMAAVEKGAIKGVVTERGTTRIIVTGDSIVFANQAINTSANRDLAAFASNWLLDRPQLLQDLGPRPVTDYRLIMTHSQMIAAQWLLLGGMPGAALLLGCLVWVRRRR